MVKQCPNLYKLKIENNQIDSIDKLKVLSQLKELKKINVKGNPFVDSNENYKKDLFNLLENLKCVDSHDKDGNEVESSDYDDEDEEGAEFEDDEGEEFDDDIEGEEFEDDGEEDDDEEDDDEVKPKKRQRK